MNPIPQRDHEPFTFDKQYVRDDLEALRWDKRPPAPPLPPDIVRQTREKYRDALQRLAGITLAPAPARDAADDALTV